MGKDTGPGISLKGLASLASPVPTCLELTEHNRAYNFLIDLISVLHIVLYTGTLFIVYHLHVCH